MTATPQFAMPCGLNDRKAWWGVQYVRAICAQAGFLFAETPAQGDVHSLDGQVFIRSTLSVFVQVKCTSHSITRQRTYPIEKAWRKNWTDLDLPGYFVVVSVPSDTTEEWAEHGHKPWSTVLKSAAFWSRIDPLHPGQKGITVQAAQRLTVDTLDVWSADLEIARKGFGSGGGAP